MHRPRRILAFLAAAAVLVVLALAAYLREAFLERWHLERLGSGSYLERSDAASALAEMRSREGFDRLVATLDAEYAENEWDSQRELARALVRFDPELLEEKRASGPGAPWIGPTIEVIGELDLRQKERFVSFLAGCLPDDDLNIDAAFALSSVGDAATSELVRVLDTGDFTARTGALMAIEYAEEAEWSDELVRKVLDALDDEDPYVRAAAADALASCGGSFEDLAPRLLEHVGDEDFSVADPSMETLCEIASAKRDLPLLVKAMARHDGTSPLDPSQTLIRIDPEGTTSIPLLLKEFQDEDNPHRDGLAFAIMTVCKESRSSAELFELVRPVFARVLKGEDADPRFTAVLSYHWFPEGARRAADDLIPLLDAEPRLRHKAARVLAGTRAVESARLVPILAEGIRADGWNCADAIAELDPEGAKLGIPALVEALEKGSNNMRDSARRALQVLPVRFEDLSPALRETMRSGNQAARAAAFEVIRAWGGRGADTLPIVLEAFRSKGLEDEAIPELVRLGSRAEKAIPKLIRLLAVVDEEPQGCVVLSEEYFPRVALESIGAAAVPALVKALGAAPDTRTRRACATALGNIGKPRDEIGRALLAALDGDSEDLVRIAAVESLGKIGHAAAGEAIERELTARDPGLRVAAAAALSRLGRSTDEAVVSALCELTRSEDNWIAWRAASLLSDNPSPEERVVDAWLGVLQCEDADLRQFAAVALGKLGPAARKALGTLRRLEKLESQNPEMRSAVAEAIRAIERRG